MADIAIFGKDTIASMGDLLVKPLYRVVATKSIGYKPSQRAMAVLISTCYSLCRHLLQPEEALKELHAESDRPNKAWHNPRMYEMVTSVGFGVMTKPAVPYENDLDISVYAQTHLIRLVSPDTELLREAEIVERNAKDTAKRIFDTIYERTLLAGRPPSKFLLYQSPWPYLPYSAFPPEGNRTMMSFRCAMLP